MAKEQERVSEEDAFVDTDEVQHDAAPEEDVEIEIVDDTPERDRGRKPAKEAIPEPTEDELDSYGEKVQERIRNLNRRFHDERRNKEAIQRERDELTNYSKRVLEENKSLKQRLASGSEVFIAKSVSEAEAQLITAKREYKEAYENGDSDKLVEAQEKIARSVAALEEAKRLRPLTVDQEQEYIPHTETTSQEEAVQPSPEAVEWASKNRWFGEDRRMTGMAHIVHYELIEDGVQPDTPEYYARIDAEMRAQFPQYFATERTNGREIQSRSRPSTVVAPASRSHAPGKVRLSKAQVAIANRLGVSLEEYARQVKLLEKQ